MTEKNEIWILGAAGRIGSSIARNLAARQVVPVLVGREGARLREIAAEIPSPTRTIVAETLEVMLDELSRSAPAVVVNTIGPFATTALVVARACPRGTHYVDMSNELFGVIELLGLHDEAQAADKCLVTGAGYGVVATESIVLKLCAGRAPASRARVDAIPFISEGGLLGTALAGSIVDSLAGGGREYKDGRLVRAPTGGEAQELVLPDGTRVVTASGPTADLEAARRASRAPIVVAASSTVPPSNLLTRLVIPILSALASWRPVRNWMVRRLARVRAPAPAKTGRSVSWSHARVEWSDGIREGWLRAGEGMVFTAAAAAEVAVRLARERHPRGAYTAAALFGPELAVAAGGEFVLGGAHEA